MMKLTRFFALAAASVVFASASQAATEWSTADYALTPGDFNNDGRTDLLYIAKSPGKPSGIALSNGTTAVPGHQSWSSGEWGIPWQADVYKAVVCDFNNDGRDDVFLQRQTAGTHYVLLTDTNGKLVGVSQGIVNDHLDASLDWSATGHRILCGDFNGDSYDDLFLQAARRTDRTAIVLANASGQFTQSGQGLGGATGPRQWWNDGYQSTKWSLEDAFVHVGRFNSDSRADIFVQPKPTFVLIDYDVSFPVPVFPPKAFRFYYSRSGSCSTSTDVFCASADQSVDRRELGIDLSASASSIVIADLNGDSYSDLLVQSRSDSGTIGRVVAGGSGVFSAGSAQSLSFGGLSNVGESAYQLLTGNFDGSGGQGAYLQARTASGDNVLAQDLSTSTSVSTTTLDPYSFGTPAAPATAVGALGVKASVSPSGSGNVAIGISVPPGIAGVQPDLSLIYDHTGGNSFVGMGWNLEGLSVITRCPKTVAQDGATSAVTLTSADAYCLGGAKLRRVSGGYGAVNSTYRTEIDNATQVTILSVDGAGSPTLFEARTRDGMILRYGGTSDSMVEPAGGTVPYVWYISESRDFAGNTMNYTYIEDRSNPAFVSQLPDSIVYTSNSGAGIASLAKVQFVYENRPDVQTAYAAGGLFKVTKRMSAIETYYRETSGSSYQLVRRYGLGYQPPAPSTNRSRLAYVQECVPSACMKETRFTYQDGTAGWATFAVTSADTVLGATNSIDINGDGREDLVYPQGSTWRYMLASTPGSAIGYQTPVNTSISNTNYDKAISFDYDGNGQRELLIPTSSQIHRMYWNGSGLTKVNLGLSWTTDDKWRAADVNGDGYEDLLIVRKCPNVCVKARLNGPGGLSSTETTLYTHPTHNAFGTYGEIRTDRFWDFNGDGRHDYLMWTNQNGCGSNCANTQRWNVLVSNGTSLQLLFDYNAPNLTPWIGDFNGDGLSDILYIPATNVWTLRFGTGMGVTGAVSTGITAPTIYQNADSTIVADYDGDGRQDVLTKYNSVWHVMRSTGEGFEAPAQLYNWVNGNLQATDINGDGLVDLGFDKGVCGVTGTCWAFGAHLGIRADILVETEDAFNLRNVFSYQPLTGSATTYTKGTGATYPELDFTGSMLVVSRLAQSDGIGGTPYIDYTYSGARVDMRGRGMLGFQKRNATDSNTGLRTEDTFLQTFPYTGMVASTIVWQGSPNQTKKLTETTNTQAVLNLSTVAGEERYFPYLSPSVRKVYNLSTTANNGNLVNQVSTTSTYDTFGNKTASTETVTDSVTGEQWLTEIVNPTINNATSSWCIGKVERREERRAIPGETLTTNPARIQEFAWNTTLCRLDNETVQPGEPMQVFTSYGYDSTGNRTDTTITGTGMTPRYSTTSFGVNRVLPTGTTNVVSLGVSATHTTGASWNYAHGARTSVTDSNGFTTNSYHDNFGRKRREVMPDGTAKVWNYFACNANNSYCGDSTQRARAYIYEQQLAVNGTPIRYSATYTDMLGRKVYESAQTVTGAESGVKFTYNSRGLMATKSAPYLVGVDSIYDTSFIYDAIGRKTREQRRVDELNSATQNSILEYDMLTTTVTDSQNKVSKSTKYATGALKSVTQTLKQMTETPIPIVTNYEYDGWGNTTKVTDNAGNQFKAKFNIRGFRYETTDPDMGVWTFTPNPLGEIVTQLDAKGQTTSMSYDELGRMYSRTEAEGVTTWNWDISGGQGRLGALRSITLVGPGNDSWYSESFTYDGLSRLQDGTTTIEGNSFTTTYGYDANTGFKNSTTFPADSGGVRTRVDTSFSYGLPSALTIANTGAVVWRANAANARGSITDATLGNGLSTRTTIDKITGWIRNRKTGVGTGTTVQNLAYEWDNVGNLYNRKDNNQSGLTEAFIYDDLHRLDSWSIPGVSNDVEVNEIGNITSMTGVGAYEYTGTMAGCSYYAHTQPHAVRRVNGSTVYCYDANGNMTRRAGDTISWYSYNLPSQIVQGASTAQFRYGASRQRVKQVSTTAATGTETTYYLPDGLERVTKSNAVVEWNHNISAPDQSSVVYTRRSSGTSDTRYLHVDHIGSVDTITNESGSILVRLSYSAYGKRRNSAGWNGAVPAADMAVVNAVSHRGFTSHEQLDGVDLIHMNGRVYDPVSGRFISADPVMQSMADPQTLNRYAYVRNNPLSYVDPSGLSFLRNWGPTIVSLFTGNWYINMMARHIAYSQTPGKSVSGWIINVWGPMLVQPVATTVVGYTGFRPNSGNLGVEIVRTAMTSGVSAGLLAEWSGGQFWEAFGNAAKQGAINTFFIGVIRPDAFAGGAEAEGEILGDQHRDALLAGEVVFIVNGINTDRKSMVERIEVTQGPAYWNKTDNFAVDLAEVIGQKLLGWAGDPNARALARYINSLPPGAKIRIIAHSGGTATVINAIKYYGMDASGKSFEFRSAAMSRWHSAKVIASGGGTLSFTINKYDIANVFSPVLDAGRFFSGFRDVISGFKYHIGAFEKSTLPTPIRTAPK